MHGYPGHGYQLQFRDNLGTGTWQNVGLAVAGDDAAFSLRHPGGVGPAQRFYRVAVNP